MKNAVVILLLFLLSQFAGTAAALLMANTENLAAGNPPDVGLLLAKPGCYAATLLAANILLLLLLYALKLARPLRQLSGKPGTTRLWPQVLAATTALAVGLSLLLTPLGLHDDGQMELFDKMKGSLPGLLLLTIAGPATEEFVFREGILRQLSLKGIPPLAAAAASTALFGLAHGNLAQAIPAALLGFSFGMVYAKTGNLLLCFAAHILNNFLGVLSLCFPEAENSLAGLPAPGLLLAGSLLCGGSAAWLAVWWRRGLAVSREIQEKHEDR